MRSRCGEEDVVLSKLRESKLGQRRREVPACDDWGLICALNSARILIRSHANRITEMPRDADEKKLIFENCDLGQVQFNRWPIEPNRWAAAVIDIRRLTIILPDPMEGIEWMIAMLMRISPRSLFALSLLVSPYCSHAIDQLCILGQPHLVRLVPAHPNSGSDIAHHLFEFTNSEPNISSLSEQ